MKKNNDNLFVKIAFPFCVLIIGVLFFQVFFVVSFRIPSDSMEPSLKNGDKILVEKLSLGARIFNVFDVLNHEKTNIHRLINFDKIDRNDVIVFNYPYPNTGYLMDSISMDLNLYYIKRCIALPGDTLSILNSDILVNNLKIKLQCRDFPAFKVINDKNINKSFPNTNKIYNIINSYGPLLIPKKGQIIKLSSKISLCYLTLIEHELNEKLEFVNDSFFYKGRKLSKYKFKENYYFVCGDNSKVSVDSRYWGLLPESYIVGRAFLIWCSIDSRNQFCWKRFFKKIV